MKKSYVVILVILLVLILDQWLKIYVKTSFFLEQDIGIFGLSWARLHFTENEGMAFGIKMVGEYGKLFLSIFRIIAVAFLGHFIYRLIQANESTGLLISFSLILAGAIGNVIDGVAYGVLFSESVNSYHGAAELATFLPEGGGYAPILYGKVVDMLYFPMVNTILPDWVPFWGGERFQFFRFIFNIADAAITTGVISILLFHRSFFKPELTEEEKATTAAAAAVTAGTANAGVEEGAVVIKKTIEETTFTSETKTVETTIITTDNPAANEENLEEDRLSEEE